jgi:hypothetical protein
MFSNIIFVIGLVSIIGLSLRAAASKREANLLRNITLWLVVPIKDRSEPNPQRILYELEWLMQRYRWWKDPFLSGFDRDQRSRRILEEFAYEYHRTNMVRLETKFTPDLLKSILVNEANIRSMIKNYDVSSTLSIATAKSHHKDVYARFCKAVIEGLTSMAPEDLDRELDLHNKSIECAIGLSIKEGVIGLDVVNRLQRQRVERQQQKESASTH